MERRGIGYWIPISIVIGISLLAIICLGVNAATIPDRLDDFGEPIPEEYRLKAEPIIVEPIVVEPVKEPVMSDRDFMAAVVMAEARGEKFIGKVAVAAVILNRAEEWNKTIQQIVEDEGQFAYPYTGVISASAYEAVDFALENRDLFPKNMLYFRSGHYHEHNNPYIDYHDYIQIGGHYFSTDGIPEWDMENLGEKD
jgi:spore germination cell wall hydrolase CwlJ-like protein